MERDWFKRRTPKPKPKAISIEVENFKLESNHFCTMIVTYDDGVVKRYISRVVQNHITKEWAVDGMHEAARVLVNDI